MKSGGIGCVIAVLVLLIGIPIIPEMSAYKNTNKYIYVDDDNTEGPWDGTLEHPYRHIQDGIDNASYGDTIYVFNGTYSDEIILHGGFVRVLANIDKPLTLVGENKDNTILDGKGSSILEISSSYVELQNLSLINGSCQGIFGGNAIYTISYQDGRSFQNIIIDNCIITGNNEGLHMEYSKNDISNVTISNCYFHNNTEEAIQLIGNTYDHNLENLLIINCRIENNTCGSSPFGNGGVIIDGSYPPSSNIQIINCSIINNNEWGILIVGQVYNISDSQESVSYQFLNNENKFIQEKSYKKELLFSKNGIGNTEMEFGSPKIKDLLIDNNDICGNTGPGISCTGSFSHSLIQNNKIINNFHYGLFWDSNIALFFCGGITLKQNTISKSNLGISIEKGINNKIIENNFIDNNLTGYFYTDIFVPPLNIWKNNYYDDFVGIGPKIIPGRIRILLPGNPSFDVRWFNIDMHPAKEPYDFGGGR